MLFGMLAHSPDGKLCLEDLEGRVELDIRNTVRTPVKSRGLRLCNTKSRGHVKVCSPRVLWFFVRVSTRTKRHLV